MDVILKFHYQHKFSDIDKDEGGFEWITIHLNNQKIMQSDTYYHALGFVDGLKYTFGALNIVEEDVYDVEF